MSAPFAPLISRLVQKRFDSPDGLEGLGALLQPTMQLIPTPDELALLAQERLFTWGTIQAAVAAQFSFATIRNPVGSNVLCTVEAIEVTIAGASDVTLVYQASPTAGVTGFSRDTRLLTSGQVRVGMSTDAAVAAGPPWAWVEQVETGIARKLSVPPIILAPGVVLTVVDNTVNQAMRVSFAWRERVMETPENAQL